MNCRIWRLETKQEKKNDEIRKKVIFYADEIEIA